MKKTKTKTILTIFLSCLITSSFAGNVTTKPQTTASLVASCTVGIDNISFSYVPQSSGNYDSSTMAHMTCTRGTTVNLQINNFVRSTCGRRELGLNGTVGGANYLLYNIYTTSAYNVIYTNTGYGCEGYGAMPNVVATGITQDLPVYVRIPANQFSVPGVYWDNVVMMFKY